MDRIAVKCGWLVGGRVCVCGCFARVVDRFEHFFCVCMLSSLNVSHM